MPAAGARQARVRGLRQHRATHPHPCWGLTHAALSGCVPWAPDQASSWWPGAQARAEDPSWGLSSQSLPPAPGRHAPEVENPPSPKLPFPSLPPAASWPQGHRGGPGPQTYTPGGGLCLRKVTGRPPALLRHRVQSLHLGSLPPWTSLNPGWYPPGDLTACRGTCCPLCLELTSFLLCPPFNKPPQSFL